MSNVATIGAVLSTACFAVAIGFSEREKGAAAKATEAAAHSRGRIRRLSITSVSVDFLVGGRGRFSLWVRLATYRSIDERSTLKSQTNSA
jgi:hypothetical protein